MPKPSDGRSGGSPKARDGLRLGYYYSLLSRLSLELDLRRAPHDIEIKNLLAEVSGAQDVLREVIESEAEAKACLTSERRFTNA